MWLSPSAVYQINAFMSLCEHAFDFHHETDKPVPIKNPLSKLYPTVFSLPKAAASFLSWPTWFQQRISEIPASIQPFLHFTMSLTFKTGNSSCFTFYMAFHSSARGFTDPRHPAHYRWGARAPDIPVISKRSSQYLKLKQTFDFPLRPLEEEFTSILP